MSQANYILICSGRGKVGIAHYPASKVVAAMECAAQVVCYVTLTNPPLSADAEAIVERISKQQHKMMDFATGKFLARTSALPESWSELIDEMFVLLDALEDTV